MSQLNSNKLKKNRTSFQPGHKGWNKGTAVTYYITYTCLTCGDEVTRKWRKDLKHRYCSQRCWLRSDEYKALPIVRRTGNSHPNWKGDKANYYSLHHWVERWLGSPSECENCGTTEASRYEWANISGEYKRDLADWARLCKQCHVLYDGIGNPTIERSRKYAR